jgi:hypothetical protein
MMKRFSLIAAALVVAGCGETSSVPQGDSYFPLEVGAKWQYDVAYDINGVLTRETYDISVPRTIDYADGGQVWVRRVEVPGSIGIEYWLRKDKVGIARIAQRLDVEEQAKLDANARIVLKLPLSVGSSWMVPTQPFAVAPKTDLGQKEVKMPKVLMTYTVEAMDETVTVPAGTFKSCARLVGVGILPLYIDAVQGFSDVPITNREWYCKGVGLVKVERDEPLTSILWSGGTVKMELTQFELPK